jgi:hypothetical protein
MDELVGGSKNWLKGLLSAAQKQNSFWVTSIKN